MKAARRLKLKELHNAEFRAGLYAENGNRLLAQGETHKAQQLFDICDKHLVAIQELHELFRTEEWSDGLL